MHENIKKWLKERLNNEERYIHSIGAEQSARELAKMFDIDEEKAALAALIHDNAKCFSNEEMLKIIEDNNLDISETEKQAYKTLHAGVGAVF
ncbi:MAG: HD domain-containing protein [Ignavibacteriales bacterium]|nr:HD domain-containing protein [Ignavibacteriales bacterium]